MVKFLVEGAFEFETEQDAKSFIDYVNEEINVYFTWTHSAITKIEEDEAYKHVRKESNNE